MAGAPQISVVVASRNRAERLAGLLRSLAAQTIGTARFEVVVVDDGSTDTTPDLLSEASRDEALELTSILGAGNGPAAARNAGWRLAKAPLVAFTDDDCEATPTWLEEALAVASAHPGAIVQGPTTPIPREADSIGPFTRTRNITEPNPSYQTCNIIYPREVLERLDGFDEGFPEALGEDTDLGWRARELGTELEWSDRVLVHHAVDDVGPAGLLRSALVGADQARIFRRHPDLRHELRWGRVRLAPVPGLSCALLGLVIGRRSPMLGALLTLPYVRHLARTCRAQRASAIYAPYYVVVDLATIYTGLRGALRHRVMVL